jgi:SAM-dependent methyltransferase
MEPELYVGDDHARVTEPGPGDPLAAHLQYFRHLFPYAEVARRTAQGARVLEVGCGAGYGAHHIAADGAVVTATDPSDQAVAYARAKYPGVTFEQADGTRLPFADGSFDVVVSFQVIEHIDDDARYLREISRVLKPSGVLYCTTPNRRLRLLPLQPPKNPYHVREYSDRSLRKLFRSVFREVDLIGVLARPDLMALEIRRVKPDPVKVVLGPVYRRIKQRWPTWLRRPPARNASKTADRKQDEPAGEASVSLRDFFLSGDTHGCLDLFCAARKTGA